jgi:hypothetical protein
VLFPFILLSSVVWGQSVSWWIKKIILLKTYLDLEGPLITAHQLNPALISAFLSPESALVQQT